MRQFVGETSNGPKIGLITALGDTIVRPKYDISSGFGYSDLAWIEECLDKNTKAKRDLGYIDIHGTEYWEN